MDANQTHFHLIFGADDWQPLIGDETLLWDATRQSVILHPLVFRFPQPPGDPVLDAANRRDAAQDRFGNRYWIADDGLGIRYQGVHATGEEAFWPREHPAPENPPGAFKPAAPPTPPPPQPLRGMAITQSHYLVVGSEAPPGLLVFDLHAGGPPMATYWPDAIPFAPFDMAAAPDGGLWMLDRTNRRLWRLDCFLRVVPAGGPSVELTPPRTDTFHPKDAPPREQPAVHFPLGIEITLAAPIETGDPVAVDVLPDGTVLLLLVASATGQSVLRRLRNGVPVGDDISLTTALDSFLDESATTFTAYDIAFVPFESGLAGLTVGTLFAVDAGGNQAFAFRLEAGHDEWALAVEPLYYPMRLYNGRALVADTQNAFYQNTALRWLPLAYQPRPRYEREGSLVSQTFDGKTPDCVWHRLYVDACLPTGTSLLVEARAANDAAHLDQHPWQRQPRLYKRNPAPGTDIPGYHPYAPNAVDEAGTWELLFQNMTGRFMQLRLTWQGDGRHTPSVKALRAYYPRFSYLHAYLPAAYRLDETSAHFLDRYLANVEGLFTVLEDHIAAVHRLFDTRTVESEYLDWLASWLGIVLDPAWDERRRRLFLRHAVALFKQRGTVPGLIRMLRLVLDACPDETLFTEDVAACSLSPCGPTAYDPEAVRIVEQFSTRSIAGVHFGDPEDPAEAETLTSEAIANAAHRFTVLIPVPFDLATDAQAQANRLALARRIVEQEKPAHTMFEAKPHWALFRVGEARLGLDTRLDLSSRESAILLGQAYLGRGRLRTTTPWTLFDQVGRYPLS
nr:phage tail protein [Ardenticatena sp.]